MVFTNVIADLIAGSVIHSDDLLLKACASELKQLLEAYQYFEQTMDWLSKTIKIILSTVQV